MYQEIDGFELLHKIGIRRGQSVLDFGCGYGTYTIPTAILSGQYGRVYALDKNKETLDELMRRSLHAGITNIVRIETHGERVIDLYDESIDIVLMFDVLHSFYFPDSENRRIVLSEIHRIMKPSATFFISVWPNLREPEIEDEIRRSFFRLAKETPEILSYDRRCSETRIILGYMKEVCASLQVALAHSTGGKYCYE